MLWTEYRPVIKIDLKGALGNHEIRPIHSAPAPSLGESIHYMDSSAGMGYLLNQIQQDIVNTVEKASIGLKF